MRRKNRYLCNLAIIRNEKGLTQLDLAKVLGVTRQTIENWEKGYTEPKNVELLLTLVKYLNCSLDRLIGNN